jgi:hypothetical protein
MTAPVNGNNSSQVYQDTYNNDTKNKKAKEESSGVSSSELTDGVNSSPIGATDQTAELFLQQEQSMMSQQIVQQGQLNSLYLSADSATGDSSSGQSSRRNLSNVNNRI